MAERRFKYRWGRTWDQVSEDYTAFTGGIPIGRVYRINSIQSGGWFYTMNGTYRNRCGSISGQVAERDAACDRVEKAWDQMKRAADGSLT